MRRGVVPGFGVLAAIALAARGALAGEPPSPEAIRAARDTVFSRGEFEYDRGTTQRSLLEKVLGWWTDLVESLQTRHPVLFLVALGAMVLLLLAIVAHMVWTVRVARRAEWKEDRLDDLEAAMRRLDPAPFRARAVALASEGRLEDAVRDLYTALLLVLDRRGAVRFASHKALLDYRIESSRDPEARAALDLFEAAYPPGSFGRRPPSRERFDGLVAALDALSDGLSRRAVGARS